MKRILRATLAIVCLFSVQVFAADKAPDWKPFDLPKEIATKQEIVNTPQGWACGKEAQPNRLASILISEGPPENQASLVYDSEAKHKNKMVATWQLDPESKERYWISCSFSGTSITVKKELPQGIKELRVSYDEEVKTDGMPTVEKVEYR